MSNTILRLRGVIAFSGQSRSNIYLHVNQGLFPKPVKLGLKAAGWPEDEIRAINQARIAGKSQEDIRNLVKKLEDARKAVFRQEGSL